MPLQGPQLEVQAEEGAEKNIFDALEGVIIRPDFAWEDMMPAGFSFAYVFLRLSITSLKGPPSLCTCPSHYSI